MIFSFLLVTSLLFWGFSLLILLSNPKSTVNKLCFISALIFSLGIFKEYLYQDLVPFLSKQGFNISQSSYEPIHSLLTSILYILATPSLLIFILEFQNHNDKYYKQWKKTLPVILIIALIYAIIFPPLNTYQLQNHNIYFWICTSIYNITYGIIYTFLVIHTIRHEPVLFIKKQKRAILLIVTPFLWFWLISIFVFHTFQLYDLMSLWKFGGVMLPSAIFLYIILAFNGGIMGLKLQSERYNWQSDEKTVNRGAHFLSHALNNDLIKLNWCVEFLKKNNQDIEEINIMSNSLKHLQMLQTNILLKTGALTLNVADYNFSEILNACDIKFYESLGVKFKLPSKKITLNCDFHHTVELLKNLFKNAYEANPTNCIIHIDYKESINFKFKKAKYNIFEISDNAKGFDRSDAKDIFKPYSTNKSGNEHLGLGLFYCARVMEAHGGQISLTKTSSNGTTFSLIFPIKKNAN